MRLISAAFLGALAWSGASAFPVEANLLDDQPQSKQGDGDRQMERRRASNDEDWFRDRSYTTAGEFPTNDVQQAVSANTNATTARALYRRADSNLDRALRQARREFEASEELKSALAEERQAYANYLSAREKALRFTATDQRYQAMVSLREALSRQIDDQRQASAPTGNPRVMLVSEDIESEPSAIDSNLLAAAQLKLDVARDMANIERDATQSSTEVQQARAELVKAGAKVSALKEGFANFVRTDDSLKTVREAVEDARIARLTAESYAYNSRKAAEAALDFAYYVRSNEGKRFYDPYYSTYGYGYGNGYYNRYRLPYVSGTYRY